MALHGLRAKLSLKALSDERAQRWPNTIKALHENRIRAKKEELEKLEHERLELDAKEARLKAERRREMEREAQIQYKKCIEEGWKRQEEKWVLMEKQQLENWDKEEEKKLQKQKEQVKALANARLNQLKECEERLMEKKRKKEVERAFLKRLEEEDCILAEEKEKARQEMIKERNLEMIKGNEAQKQLLASKVDNEKRLEKEQSQKRDFDDRREQMRIESNKKGWEECDRSRQMQIKAKHDQEMCDAADEKYEAEKTWERAWQCKMEFQDLERERLLKNKAFAEHHKRTMGYIKTKEIEDARCEMEDERLALQRMEDEERSRITLDDFKK